jgi:class 3 adenylate cyclase/tetratricopeptide (TPR) repeat protein
MERKLATVLFADLVGSTELVASTDPEIVRSQVTRFFDQVAHCINAHGGMVEKFAGDAVMAAFGVPVAHEDDPERAVRAALSIVDSVRELGLDVRIGVESGEIVADETEATFATGRAVNAAARLQQAAKPGEVLLGPEVQRLTIDTVATSPIGAQAARGFPAGVEAWRVDSVSDQVGRRLVISVPFVGREEELELLHNTFARAERDRRAHLLTLFGEAGVGKSRLAREFTAGVERATVLSGRCLPYGEGVTYWALAEMVKAAAGITDDDSAEAATEKLRASCGEDAVADLLGLATGVLDAVGGERSASEISWAAQTWATELADVQPLVLVFEDIHWAEESMLDLIEHLAGAVRGVAVLILCLARADLLDERPTWGGGKVRASAMELEALPEEDGGRLVDALVYDESATRGLSAEQRAAVLESTEGNPLFIEEMVRALLEGGGPRAGLPRTVQAVIAARIDRLPRAEKAVLQRAAVAGRTFWSGAVEAMTDGPEAVTGLGELVQRDFLVREQRSTIRGEEAYRFKHVLIRDVAYAGLSKSTRALLHRKMASWLTGRTVADELVEIRAYHLDEAAQLLLELEGRVPAELAADAAATVEHAGRRAHAREANRSARRLFVRAVELEPTLERRYLAARAAWRMTDIPTVSTEMKDVCDAAHEAGDRRIEGRALTALAHVALSRDGDNDRARELAARALEVIDADDDIGRFDALELLATVGWWEGNLAEVERIAVEKLAIAERLERRDLQSGVLLELTDVHESRFESELACEPLARAIELASDSGSPTTRAFTLRMAGRQALLEGRLDEAEESLEQALTLFSEGGVTIQTGRTLNGLGLVAWKKAEFRRAEELLREAIRLLKPLQDRGTLVESQRILAQVLLDQNRVDDAERLALDSLETVGAGDVSSSSTTRLALGLVRAAQGKHDEAERLLRESIEILRPTGFRRQEAQQLAALADFLRKRGRESEALAVDDTLAALTAGSPAAPAL